MTILYYDCFAGISGDMNLGALLDLGVEEKHLRDELAKLQLEGYELMIQKDMRKGISGTRVNVLTNTEKISHHKNNQQAADHHHDHHHHHHHDHDHHHDHHHRAYSDIRNLINSSKLSDDIKQLSIKIFEKVALAEAKIHNKTIDSVAFHEVGAIDSIVDIVGAAICIRALAPDKIMVSTVELGGGSVQCAHGLYPVPAPATAEIIKGIPVCKGKVAYEATTPTGAAILAACADEFSDSYTMKINKTGYGIGQRDGEIPNVLRVYWSDTADHTDLEVTASTIVECNIDDMNPEFYDFIIESLFEAGAKDVYITPIIMKKSRPAVTLSVLTGYEAEQKVEEILLTETSTLGIRKYTVEKIMLQRKAEFLDTPYGQVRIKAAYYNKKRIKSKPEYEDCLKIAREKNMPLSQIYKEIEKLLLINDNT
ncbi:MAG: nickel pincer cofactor biosynthesis protein LarC [Bacteroidales bacterium]|nr:nickel pincer cofactor biosynthesis protein LarC [Bacteroidales bacterium]